MSARPVVHLHTGEIEMHKKIYLLITTTDGIPDEPSAFTTEAARNKAYRAYCRKSGGVKDNDFYGGYDLSCTDSAAFCFTLDSETLKIA